ncbi:MAG TPA: aromatic-ring-hydroxylating dioxygenase subunit beta [Pseudonocardia sp.]|jgi:ethylbenzene dioxygenase beta subunit
MTRTSPVERDDIYEVDEFGAPGAFPRGIELNATDPRFEAVRRLLLWEATLLDNLRQREWLGLLHEDVRYRVPVRVTRWRTDGLGFTGAMHMDETYESFEGRVARLETNFAWGEDPPSRTRRFVSNLRVEQQSDDPDRLNVTSYLLLTRSRWDNPTYQLISAERRDILTGSVNNGYRLIRRHVLLDQSNLGTVNMAVIL